MSKYQRTVKEIHKMLETEEIKQKDEIKYDWNCQNSTGHLIEGSTSTEFTKVLLIEK